MSAARNRKIRLPLPIARPAVFQAKTGMLLDKKLWQQQKDAEAEIKRQTEIIASRLEAEGYSAIDHSRAIHVVGLCSGLSEETTCYRNINFLPSVQSRNVRDMITSLTYWMDCVPESQRRMLVISNGWVPVSGYRQHHTEFRRRISRWAAHEKLSDLGIEVVYANIENTLQISEGACADTISLNQHSHVIVRCRRYLGREKWTAFIEWTRRQFRKGYVHDAGKIRSPNEAVKYAFKPLSLLELPQDVLAVLAEQCERLRFYVPMGELRELRRELEPVAERVDPRTGEIIPARGRRRLIRVQLKGRNVEWRILECGSSSSRPDRESEASVATADVIVAVTLPHARFTRRCEPCLIVSSYSGQLDRLMQNNPGYREIQRQALALYEAHTDPKWKSDEATDIIIASSD